MTADKIEKEIILKKMRDGLLTADSDEWSVEYNSSTVAHIAAAEGRLPVGFYQWDIRQHRFSRSVAHEAAKHSELPADFKLWGIADATGWTVGHEAASLKNHKVPADFWKEMADGGWTVAHVMATNGTLPSDYTAWDEVCFRSASELLVGYVAASYGHFPAQKENLKYLFHVSDISHDSVPILKGILSSRIEGYIKQWGNVIVHDGDAKMIKDVKDFDHEWYQRIAIEYELDEDMSETTAHML
jgi:hypothetical protein